MPMILALFARWGVPERFRSALAWALASIVVIALMLALWALITRHDSKQQAIGATEQRNTDLTATVKNVEKANAAAEKVRRDPAAADDECMRNARNPADC
ncbi:hypothetical protein [Novosphingobium colocasiae]|uniref:hypothetical protein n=1 Tax=Novosphingobium colocasiae TaxID=1256513 RepID=UPI0035B2F3DE